MSYKHEVHVHIHRHLGIEGRLAAYELATQHHQRACPALRRLEHLMEAY